MLRVCGLWLSFVRFLALVLGLGAVALVNGCGGGSSSPASSSGSGGSAGGGATTPTPAVSSISPATMTAGSGALTLTVTGSGFLSTSVVQVGTIAEPTTYISATQLTAIVPGNSIGQRRTIGGSRRERISEQRIQHAQLSQSRHALRFEHLSAGRNARHAGVGLQRGGTVDDVPLGPGWAGVAVLRRLWYQSTGRRDDAHTRTLRDPATAADWFCGKPDIEFDAYARQRQYDAHFDRWSLSARSCGHVERKLSNDDRCGCDACQRSHPRERSGKRRNGIRDCDKSRRPGIERAADYG